MLLIGSILLSAFSCSQEEEPAPSLTMPALPSAPEPRVLDLSEVLELRIAGKTTAAIELLRSLATEFPDSAEVLVQLGRSLAEAKEFALAAFRFEQAVSLGASREVMRESAEAARSWLRVRSAEFAWGDDDPQESAPLANTWQGTFPFENTELDGWTRTSPVGSYPPNGYGLHDMTGNTWEWTDDWYTNDPASLVAEPSCCSPPDPRGARQEDSFDPYMPGTPIPRKVVKGGSHLCTPQYCYRYRPAARQPQMIDTGMSHLGFRRVVDP